jgi:hypothetical protein
MVSEGGERLRVAEAPLFMDATEVSWRLRGLEVPRSLDIGF